MTAYLQKFVEATAQMPHELARVMAEIRELDTQQAALQAQADAALVERLQKAGQQANNASAQRSRRTPRASNPAAAPLRMDEKLATTWDQIRDIAEQKVALSKELYEYVDAKIRAVDRDMKTFDNELARTRQQLSLPPGETDYTPSIGIASSGGLRSATQRQKNKRKRGGSGDGYSGGSRDAFGSADSSPTHGAALPPFSPGGTSGAAASDEPTYCYCQRVSFGDMIACDNDDCAIEWFHLACAGLPPDFQAKGKWYCKECTVLKQEGKIS